MKKMLIAAVVAVLCCLAAHGQRTTRPRLVLASPQQQSAVAPIMADTIGADSARACVRFSGFEKTLRSRRESVHATNLLAADTIAAIEIEIEYLDLKGRQLHSRTISVDCEIPPGQTRMVDFPSWDKQQVWHYRLSKPPRSEAQATPFDVRIAPISLVVLR